MMKSKFTKGIPGGIYPAFSVERRTEGSEFCEKEVPPNKVGEYFVPGRPGELRKTEESPGADEEEGRGNIPEVGRKITAREVRDGFILSVIVGEPVSRTLRRKYGRRRHGPNTVK